MSPRTVRLPRRVITLVAAGGLATTGAAALATGWTAQATPGDGHQVWVCAYVGPKSDRVLKPGKNPLLVDRAAVEGGTFRGSTDEVVIIQVGGEDPGIEACLPETPPSTTSSTVPTTTTETTTTVPTETETTTTVPTETETTTTVPATETTTTVPTETETTTTVPATETTTTVPATETTTTVPATETTTTVPATETTTTVPATETTTTVPATETTTTATTTSAPAISVPTSTAATSTAPAVVAPVAVAPSAVAPSAVAGVGASDDAPGVVPGVVPGAGAPHTGGAGEAPSDNRLLGSGLIAGGLALAAGEAARRRRENAVR
ncbi:MAG: hypothetical protein ACKOVB_15725 [Terrabacter sp.]